MLCLPIFAWAAFCGSSWSRRENIPAFGVLIRVASPVGNGAIYGLIYDVSIEDDLFVRHLIAADLARKS